jgi:hypothetical protein
MQIRKLDVGRPRDVRRFVSLPYQLYHGCPQWVPPLLSDAKKHLDPRKHPFYEHSVADFYVAEERGRTLGRVAVMENRRYNAFSGHKDAFFGFFDAVDEVAVSRALFGAAFEWACARGLEAIVGPRGMIGADTSGVLVEGFEHRPALGVPYNYPYYDALLRDAGFVKDTDHLSGYFRGDHPVPERFYRLAERVRARRGYWVKSFDSKDEMRGWVPRVREVHRRAFEGSHSFYPPTEAEMEAIAGTIIDVTVPGLIKLVMRGDDLIGFMFAYPDLSAGLQRAGGRLWPLGWMHLLRERRRTTWVNCNGVGVLPEHRGLGPGIVLYVEIDKAVKELGYEHVDVVMVDEKNASSYSIMETMGVEWYKRHRSYYRAL